MAKKKAGKQQVNNIKTSNFLPNVFQTDLNKNWLDSTLDQMVSKGPLDDIDVFVGSRKGDVAESGDVYLEPKVYKDLQRTTQLSPGIVAYNNSGKTTNTITFDDVAHSINQNFSTYNYNSAYASHKYGFNPPIDIDKFVNYVNYRWVEELPIYESIYTGSTVNPLTEINTNNMSTITDDNNSFVLENQMLIKFTGSGWHTDVLNKTYIVTGSVSKYTLREYISNDGISRVYENNVKHSVSANGVWFNKILYNAELNSAYGASSTPEQLVDDYNNTPVNSRLPFFDGFDFPQLESNTTVLDKDILVKFTGTWTHGSGTNNNDIFSLTINATTGNVSILPATTQQITLAETTLSPDNNLMYNDGIVISPDKDYIVVNKNDSYQSAWSRNNHWVNISTINKLQELITGYDFTEIRNKQRIALRPIIEFNASIEFYTHAGYKQDQYVGAVTHGIKQNDSVPTGAGETYVYVDNHIPSGTDHKIYVVGGTDIVLEENDTFTINNAVDTTYKNADMYFTDKIKFAQQKHTVNQNPLYSFYNHYGNYLGSINGKKFDGDKIFGYKIGTGANDTELGFPLSYKDTPKGAEYEFENFIITQKYYSNYANSEYSRGTYSKDQIGFNLFKQHGVLKSIYAPSGDPAGAHEHKQYKINAADDSFVIPYGWDNWRQDDEFVVHQELETFVLTRKNISGNNNLIDQTHQVYTVGESQEIKFTNLTGDTLYIKSHGSVISDNSASWVDTYTSSGSITTLTTSASSNDTYFDIYLDNELVQCFIVSKQYDQPFYKITQNGNPISPSNITVTNSSITLDQSILVENDLIDFEWTNNDLNNSTLNVSMPDVHKHNANNDILETFTISQTLNHWKDKLNVMPGFDNNTFGENNYASVPHTPYYGGTIFLHEDLSIMHDINYADTKLSITGSLLEQGTEFVAFRQRVSDAARKIWTKTGAMTIQQLTDNAIGSVTKVKPIYTNSNMLVLQSADRQEFILRDIDTTQNKTFNTRFEFNGDVNIRDHVYVYLTQDNGNETQVRKLLIKDKDYTMIGNTIKLILSYEPLDSKLTNPMLEVYWTGMDDWCFVPASLVKLGLGFATEPQVNNNILYTHDGTEIDVTGKDLENVNAGASFDPANAVIFEMEKRIYNGLVKEDNMYKSSSVINVGLEKYHSPIKYLPAPHHNTWYELADLNNYLEKHYYQWTTNNNIKTLNSSNYYDANDSSTWNYSTLSAGGDFTDKLPGHWKGAYTHIFGTCTPHITPWHMLGYAFKPTWWDKHYSWTDPTKRDKLIVALKTGLTSEPGLPKTHVPLFARHTWNWSTQCPVTTTGTLQDPSTVLDPTSSLSNVDKEKEFVFGDWGPVEFKWRSSDIGRSLLLDGVLKLNPTKAWSDFFQPGSISKHNSLIRSITHYDRLLPSSHSFKTPNKVYGKTITSIKIKPGSSPSTFENNGFFQLLDDFDSTLGRANFEITESSGPGTITAISMIERPLDIVGQYIISYAGNDADPSGIDFDVKLNTVSFVANGIAQAQYNFLTRHGRENILEEHYGNLDTKLVFKLGGFTSKHLLHLSTETSEQGCVILGDADYNVEMYKGAVSKLITASALTITKTLTGYKVSGINHNTREFKFLEPNITNPTDYVSIEILNQTLRRYNKFVATPSIVEYDAEFTKIQDVYNFIRGYWEWMRVNGYELQYDGNTSAYDFVTWTTTAEVGFSHILQIGRKLKYTPAHGHVSEFNTLTYNNNSILSSDSIKIENTKLGITRTDGKVSVETKSKEFIGSITSAELDFEHVVIIEDSTTLGITLFDDVKDSMQSRLCLCGQRTQNWNGEKKAPGYLVSDDHIIQNFDSAVQSIDDLYRTDVDEFNRSFGKAKDITIGKTEGLLLEGLGLNENILTNYYQGMIKEKGTRGAIEHIGKSNILNFNETTISAYEQYMFRQSVLGNDDLQDPLEIEIVSSDINSSPQTISLNTGASAPNFQSDANVIDAYIDADQDNINERIVNNKSITFDTLSYDESNSDILTGGEALETETTYRVLSTSDISSVFDSTAEYANIETWAPNKSYRLGDQVRMNGELWECNVEFTGVTQVSSSIEVTSRRATDTAIIPNGTQANIAGIPTTLIKNDESFANVVVNGNDGSHTYVPITGDASSTLVINGAPITFNKIKLVPTINGPAVIYADGTGDFSDPVTGVTNHSISITTRKTLANNTVQDTTQVVDFDTTPGNITETFTGDAIETIFTLSQPLLGARPNNYNVSSVTVDGVLLTDPADYSVDTGAGNITFTTAPSVGVDNIVVVLVHQVDTMTQSEIITHIDSYNIPNLTTSLTPINGTQRITLSFQSSDHTERLILDADLGNGTNAQLDLPPAGINVQQDVTDVEAPDVLTVEEVRDQINNTSSSLLTYISASVITGNIVITQSNRSDTSPLVMSGNVLTSLGLSASTPGTSLQVPVPVSYDEAASQIQAQLTLNSITGVTVIGLGNRIKFESTNASLDLGDTSFNTVIGLPTGTVTSSEVNVDNEWDTGSTPHQTKFTRVDQSLDPALYNILISDDSDFVNSTVGSTETKFWSWNVLQVTQRYAAPGNETLYTKPDEAINIVTDNPTTCGICAGTASIDGNDAEVTTNVDHGLKVGDYVQLLNTTTTPNIDGIHKVTKIGSNNKIFYIDEYIESCGNAVSVMPLVTTRFETTEQKNLAVSSTDWNLPTGTTVFVNNKDNVRGTYVHTVSQYNTESVANTVTGTTYRIITTGDTNFTSIGAADSEPNTVFTATGIGSGTGTVEKVTYTDVRSTTTRPTNTDIDSVLIYSHTNNQSKIQLEIWDPMRKILPGVAQQNLDYSNFTDNAVYTTSTDDNQYTDVEVAWSNDQVGTRWWDTSKVRYYDYDQGDSVYKSNYWGKLYPGSEVVVWEWSKSTVSPDEYAEQVTNQKEMFGKPATGEAYSKYDNTLKETLYYYTTEQEWNVRTNAYDTVYYFWVKNKTTIEDSRILSAYDVANIIADPTNAGVSWFAVISDKEFIVDNINYYIDDIGTVLQINKAGNKYSSHNEWTLIAKDSDTIPEYYIDRMKRNFAGRDSNKVNIPFYTLHKFNRYGDEIEIGQTWFKDLSDARRNAIITINSLMKNINLADEYKDTWDRTFNKNNFPSFLWVWSDYVSSTYHGTYNFTTKINEYKDLNTIDKTLHSVVKYEIFDTEVQLDRSETYAYNKEILTWELVYKSNNTIQFNEELLVATGGWDVESWDAWPYDQADIAEYWETLIEALYKDMFVSYNVLKMNTFFFSVIHYVLSSFEQTNWIKKTTYIKLDLVDQIRTQSRKYRKDKTNDILGYIHEVKPYHTKLSTITAKNTHLEDVMLTVTEQEHKTHITMNINDTSSENKFGGGIVYEGEDFNEGDTPTDMFSPTVLTDFTTTPDNEIVYGVDFTEAQAFNYIEELDGLPRNGYVKLSPIERLSIGVQTNTAGSTHNNNSRTFAHMIGSDGFVRSYALTEANETTLTADFTASANIIQVVSTSSFDQTGTAYVGGELIDYTILDATTLSCTKRGVLGTFNVSALNGTSVIQVDKTQLTFANDDPSELQYNTLGDTILNSPGSLQAQELQTYGKGVGL